MACVQTPDLTIEAPVGVSIQTPDRSIEAPIGLCVQAPDLTIKAPVCLSVQAPDLTIEAPVWSGKQNFSGKSLARFPQNGFIKPTTETVVSPGPGNQPAPLQACKIITFKGNTVQNRSYYRCDLSTFFRSGIYIIIITKHPH